ncbi:MAG: RdgB/HAM1 family non-canonical purine NTP pyrophosphatase [Candidatus Methylopumilus sp.]|nr:RdgB/HAM1 family non-canonical purine NTP pyrophosphatase [Candidatus Methylopumilus sp.]
MKDKIVIATGNAKKLIEIQSILEDINVEVLPQSYFNIAPTDEPFHTFIENALIKARHASRLSKLPAIADDSGISVDALGGQPGVLSARFAGEPSSDQKNNEKLLKILENEVNRKAHYTCVIVFVRNEMDPEPIIAEGIWHGEILKVPRGIGGFGYDSLFLDHMTEKTVAELPSEIKNRISHRGQALHKLKLKLNQIYG